VTPTPQRAHPAPFVGVGALAALLFCYLASLLFAPWWYVATLVVLWVVLVVLAFRWWTPRPRTVLALPLVGLAVWVGSLLLLARAG